MEGSIAQWLAYLLLDSAALGLIPSIPNFFQKKKLSTLLSLSNRAGLRKEDSGLQMLIEPIKYWPVASRYKKMDFHSYHCLICM